MMPVRAEIANLPELWEAACGGEGRGLCGASQQRGGDLQPRCWLSPHLLSNVQCSDGADLALDGHGADGILTARQPQAHADTSARKPETPTASAQLCGNPESLAEVWGADVK